MLRGLRFTGLLFAIRLHDRLAIRHQGALRRSGRILYGLPSGTLPRGTPLRPRQLFPRLRPINITDVISLIKETVEGQILVKFRPVQPEIRHLVIVALLLGSFSQTWIIGKHFLGLTFVFKLQPNGGVRQPNPRYVVLIYHLDPFLKYSCQRSMIISLFSSNMDSIIFISFFLNP